MSTANSENASRSQTPDGDLSRGDAAESDAQVLQEGTACAPRREVAYPEGRTYFERAYGSIAEARREQEFPLPPAGAPARPHGSIGPVAPTTLGLNAQVRAMMLAATGTPKHHEGAFQADLDLHRRVIGQLPLTRGDRYIGQRGHVCAWAGQRVRATS